MYCPRIVNINAFDVYMVLYDDRASEYIKRINDENYLRDVVIDAFGEEYYIYVLPILVPDFDKMN